MKDIQYKSAYRDSSFKCSETDFRPDVPAKTVEMINRKFKEWQERRGLVPQTAFKKQIRGIAARRQKNSKNASKIGATTPKKNSRKVADKA